ncbi:MAG: Glutamate racemase 1 [Deltaproteobacteria bacterium ADurb.Bin207]|nr:MAG: Glutamate racemase 1 [Deltaproteobacteria bacterium ADurb.Bin207]
MPESASNRKDLNVSPIGIFDSGVGGLSVWRKIVQQLPAENTLYFADQAHIPYGQAALHALRETFPDVPFVGMEPAVKPAVEQTRTGIVGVIATTATFQGDLFAGLVERFGNGFDIHTQACPGLVEAVEAGALDTPETESLLRSYLVPLLDVGIDQLVLGCTHYPFLSQAIQRIVGPDVTLIDPAPAVARQVERVLIRRNLLASWGQIGRHQFYTSSDPAQFAAMAHMLTGVRHITHKANLLP